MSTVDKREPRKITREEFLGMLGFKSQPRQVPEVPEESQESQAGRAKGMTRREFLKFSLLGTLTILGGGCTERRFVGPLCGSPGQNQSQALINLEADVERLPEAEANIAKNAIKEGGVCYRPAEYTRCVPTIEEDDKQVETCFDPTTGVQACLTNDYAWRIPPDCR